MSGDFDHLRDTETMRSESSMTMSNGIIVAIHYKNGVMLGAEKTATINGVVISRTCPKIFRLHNNIYCGGSGSASDISNVTRSIESQLQVLHQRISQRRVPVVSAKKLLKKTLMHGFAKVLASFIIIGVDRLGMHLYSLHCDGTSEYILFNAIGLGRFAAMAILENRWHLDIDENDARDLIIDAINAAFSIGGSSGYNIDLCIIRKDFSVEHRSETIRPIASREMQEVNSVQTPLNSDWLRDVTITKENVIILTPPSRPPSPSPSPSQTPTTPRIRPFELRTTTATMQLNESPPKKKKKL
ncbi:proteasome subunit beta type-2 [Drosophila grimshawi]|uniref:Proteasome subunit beta n=1 Tax=Drosophila grimshawi TaxID=7222 RepID=B4IZJ6_DROGR|nr:proteasome subunit beta type-2 [Drosophila grimshawi]XP_032596536.1 proteasome subunit beta type-2 [Drosophila grimshawi]EDV97771.1 GH17051 [Drosophila grimshawi]